MKAKSIMIQGTSSSVGKSLIATGLCRILKQDQFRVAPFKSQNLALNSFVTSEGKEMGRAQVVQAEAAGIEPSVLMNPILLKITNGKKAQVIINGEVFNDMPSNGFNGLYNWLKTVIMSNYDYLAEKNDVIVIEGAGSPVEINLKDNDIVNMGMAAIADAPVILVGDIERGGVFASLAGTMLLLNEEEKRRVKGVIINKFHGDIEMLKPGLKMLEDIIKVPVLGVLPYTKLDIEDEDSMAERFVQEVKSMENELDIVVIKVPHISNFTDFNAIENIGGIKLRYEENANNLGTPDLIILPGTKSTVDDLVHLRNSGMEKAIINLHRQKVPIIGICGGYQMLGLEIEDPMETESSLKKVKGLGLLNVKTIFRDKKVTTQVEGSICDKEGICKDIFNTQIKGYEIHMGETKYFDGCTPFLTINKVMDEKVDMVGGVRNTEGTVFGTYVHGIFDNIEFTYGLINHFRLLKGIKTLSKPGVGFREYKEEQYNKLADMIKENLDMKKIYEIIGLY